MVHSSIPPPTARVKVSGEFACWTRPENKVERVSYECMTPSAARNILDAICWKPQFRWVVTRILVLNKIQFQALRRNELQSKIAPKTVAEWMADPSRYRPLAAGAGSDEVTQRNTLALRAVSYIIEAYPHVYQPTADDTPIKYAAMLNRRVQNGQCFVRPALGCREFGAVFEPPGPEDKPIDDNVDIGRMLYDIVFRPEGNRAVFFEARLEHGGLDTRPERAIPDARLRQEVLACSYRH
jgi:CRISPR-associated protein Cas5d